MPSRQPLDLPARTPRWATDAGRTVEPSETDKDTGHVVGTRPVARWENDWDKLVYQWIQKLSSSIVAPIIETDDSTGASTGASITCDRSNSRRQSLFQQRTGPLGRTQPKMLGSIGLRCQH